MPRWVVTIDVLGVGERTFIVTDASRWNAAMRASEQAEVDTHVGRVNQTLISVEPERPDAERLTSVTRDIAKMLMFLAREEGEGAWVADDDGVLTIQRRLPNGKWIFLNVQLEEDIAKSEQLERDFGSGSGFGPSGD